MEMLLLFLSTIGLTWILVKSTIFKPFREYVSKKRIIFLDSVMNCEGCMGVWSAGVVYVLNYYNIEIVLYCFSGSYLCVLAMALLKMINSK